MLSCFCISTNCRVSFAFQPTVELFLRFNQLQSCFCVLTDCRVVFAFQPIVELFLHFNQLCSLLDVSTNCRVVFGFQPIVELELFLGFNQLCTVVVFALLCKCWDVCSVTPPPPPSLLSRLAFHSMASKKCRLDFGKMFPNEILDAELFPFPIL